MCVCVCVCVTRVGGRGTGRCRGEWGAGGGGGDGRGSGGGQDFAEMLPWLFVGTDEVCFVLLCWGVALELVRLTPPCTAPFQLAF